MRTMLVATVIQQNIILGKLQVTLESDCSHVVAAFLLEYKHSQKKKHGEKNHGLFR